MKLNEIVNEAAGEPLLLSMLRRLDPMIKTYRVYYQGHHASKPKLLLSWEEDEEIVSGVSGKSITFTMQAPDPSDYRPWKATLPMHMLDDYTIKGEGEGDSKIFTIKKKDDVSESSEKPAVVMLLSKAIANHFKKAGKQVLLRDKEYDTNAAIYGYKWLNNNLTVHIRTPNGNREIIYPANVLSGLRIKSDPDEDAYVLTYDPAKVNPDEASPAF